jgi:hypothetical protein
MQDWWRFSFLTRRRRHGKKNASGSFFDDAFPKGFLFLFRLPAFHHVIRFRCVSLYLPHYLYQFQWIHTMYTGQKTTEAE